MNRDTGLPFALGTVGGSASKQIERMGARSGDTA